MKIIGATWIDAEIDVPLSSKEPFKGFREEIFGGIIVYSIVVPFSDKYKSELSIIREFKFGILEISNESGF